MIFEELGLHLIKRLVGKLDPVGDLLLDEQEVEDLGEHYFPFAPLCPSASTIPFRMMSCLLYTSPSPRDQRGSRMPSSA